MDLLCFSCHVSSRDALVRLELKKLQVDHVHTLLVCPMAIDTGMFQGILSEDTWRLRLARFLLPMQRKDDVANEILDAIQRRKPLLISCARGWRGVLLPWAPALARLLPVSIFDLLMSIAGGVDGMDTFVGRNDRTSSTYQ